MIRIFTAFLFVIISSFAANARWMKPEESPISISEKANITVFKDGSSENITLRKIKILKESAKDQYGRYQLRYNNTSESLEILEAKSITGGVEHVVEKNNIQDEKVASSINDAGFDSQSQILISFTNLEVGSELIVKAKHHIKKSFLKDFYSSAFGFGENELTTTKEITINSEIPLYVEINDKLGILKHEESESNGLCKYKVNLTKSLIQVLAFESGNSFVSDRVATWVHFTSSKDWQDFGSRMYAGYIKAAADGLPDLHLEIANKARKISNEIDRLNFITSELNKSISYFGDWQTLEGGYFPRKLAEVAKTKLGDCKDFSSSLSAILNYIGGYDVSFAFVFRGQGIQRHFFSDPNMYASNHVMIKAINKETGKIFWIDPTNSISMAQGIFPDVAGKHIFVINAKSSGLEYIPEISPDHSQIISTSLSHLHKENKLKYQLTLDFLGESSFGLTGLGLSLNKNEIKDYIYNNFFEKPVPVENQLRSQIPNLTDRNVKDLRISLEFFQNDDLIKTNLGPAFLEEKSLVADLLDFDKTFVGTIYIGEPQTVKSKNTIKKFKIDNFDSINYQVSSPWLRAIRKVSTSGPDTIIEEEYSIFKKFISREERETKEFKQLQQELKKNFGDLALIKTNQPN